MTTAKASPQTPPMRAMRPAVRRAPATSPAPRVGPDQRLGGDRHRVEGERAEHPQLQGDLVGAERGRAEPGGDRGGGEEAGLERRARAPAGPG